MKWFSGVRKQVSACFNSTPQEVVESPETHRNWRYLKSVNHFSSEICIEINFLLNEKERKDRNLDKEVMVH